MSRFGADDTNIEDGEDVSVSLVAENLPTLPPLVIGNLHIKRH